MKKRILQPFLKKCRLKHGLLIFFTTIVLWKMNQVYSLLYLDILLLLN